MQLTWSAFQRFNTSAIPAGVPSDAGVYILWVQLQDEKWRCFYVGQANDLRQRLNDHINTTEPNECLKNKVQNKIVGVEYALVGRQADRDGVESFLYQAYKKPECNVQTPSATPIQVNLP